MTPFAICGVGNQRLGKRLMIQAHDPATDLLFKSSDVAPIPAQQPDSEAT